VAEHDRQWALSKAVEVRMSKLQAKSKQQWKPKLGGPMNKGGSGLRQGRIGVNGEGWVKAGGMVDGQPGRPYLRGCRDVQGWRRARSEMVRKGSQVIGAVVPRGGYVKPQRRGM
jgi:hypothetical protein